jgi:hypothetical protein
MRAARARKKSGFMLALGSGLLLHDFTTRFSGGASAASAETESQAIRLDLQLWGELNQHSHRLDLQAVLPHRLLAFL